MILQTDVVIFDPVARQWRINGQPTHAITTKPPRRGRGLWSVRRGDQRHPPEHYAAQIRRALGVKRNSQVLYLEKRDTEGLLWGWSVVRTLPAGSEP
jgi:hypothetical protein